jgi:hypothetical protein
MKARMFKSFLVSLFVALMFLAGIGQTTAEAQRRGSHHGGPVIVHRPHYRYGGPRFGYGYGWGWRSPGWSLGWGWNYPYWGSTVTVINPIAAQRESGYRDGHKRGREDAKHGREYLPASHDHYRDSHSYTYRQAFLQGYADGYDEWMNGGR